MGIEFELKYSASPEQQDRLQDRFPGDWQRISMETTYYDTPDGTISSRHYTLRRRLENGRSVYTVKTPAGGLDRGEWEVEAESILSAVPELCKLGAPADLPALTAGGPVPVCGARFLRRACTLEAEGAVVELALDRGILFAGEAQRPLCEVEVELKSGSREAAMLFARQLAEQFGLTAEPRSKFRRAMDLGKEKESCS